MRLPLEDLVEQIAAGALHIQIGKTFQLDEIVEAHRCMEENKASGKIVADITTEARTLRPFPEVFSPSHDSRRQVGTPVTGYSLLPSALSMRRSGISHISATKT
jgi:hypothetical protein